MLNQSINRRRSSRSSSMHPVILIYTCTQFPHSAARHQLNVPLFSNCTFSRVGFVGGGWPPPLSSCLRTLIFEWKSALNFNPWAKFQTIRQLTPSSFRSIPTLTFSRCFWWSHSFGIHCLTICVIQLWGQSSFDVTWKRINVWSSRFADNAVRCFSHTFAIQIGFYWIVCLLTYMQYRAEWILVVCS